MKINAKGIALAGIGSAISLVFVVLSHYLNALNITFNALAAAGTLVRLPKTLQRGAFGMRGGIPDWFL